EDIYDYAGGGVGLKKMGVVFARGLNGPKARIRLIVGLNSEKNPAELKEFLEQ
ncbi:asparaginase, partial [Enterococcus faecalis]|nr:asparaginase [Enterococcus faecalis]